MKKLLILLLFISSCTGNAVYDLEGPFVVTNVVDGDTIDLANGDRVRLSGIDTPESGECYKDEVKDKLEELVLDKEIYLEKDNTNRGKYDRLLRYVYVDDILVNFYLVGEGYAKVYDKYKDETKRYDELKEFEKLAISKKMGVWSCEDPREGCLYVRSKNSEIYHEIHCKSARRIKEENLICINSTDELEGLRPSKSC
tara:strand:+ start:269 stop:862 length:594 start_codon:yes stop_codon:yes gene_type:complete